MADSTEYVFLQQDGSASFEIVFDNSDVSSFMSMHHAVEAVPLSVYEQRKSLKVEIHNPKGVNNGAYQCNRRQVAGILRPMLAEERKPLAGPIQDTASLLKRGESKYWDFTEGFSVVITNTGDQNAAR